MIDDFLLARWKQEYLDGDYDKPDLVADLVEAFRDGHTPFEELHARAVALVEEWAREKRSRSVR